MKYKTYTEQDTKNMIELWNKECVSIGYKSYESPEEFNCKIMGNTGFSPSGCILAYDDHGKLAGFVNAIIQCEFLPGQTDVNTPGYIHILMVGKEWKKQGIGSMLLHLAEDYLKSCKKTEVRFSHKCPVKMSWYVDKEGHEHNKAPGIKLDSYGYSFFHNRGYELVQKEVSYYLDLKVYMMPEDIRRKTNILEEEGFKITFFNQGRNFGYEEMFQRLHDESFLKKFRDGIKEHKKILIVEDRDGRVCASAGVVYPEDNGRGFFSALAADPAYGGKGIGQVLFFQLCYVLKQMGAEYMTLFVTSDNFARKIYDKAGFKVVQEWGIITKAL